MNVKIILKCDVIEFDNVISYKIEDNGMCIYFDIECYKNISEFGNICITSKFEIERNELKGLELL